MLMCKCVVNVQMCECANVRMVALICCALLLANAFRCKCFSLQMLSYTKATICTFAHSHICTLTKHLHINQAFAH